MMWIEFIHKAKEKVEAVLLTSKVCYFAVAIKMDTVIMEVSATPNENSKLIIRKDQSWAVRNMMLSAVWCELIRFPTKNGYWWTRTGYRYLYSQNVYDTVTDTDGICRTFRDFDSDERFSTTPD